jgi:hypothetical protein
MCSAPVAAVDWLKVTDSVAIWLEGIALMLIFFWDRKDHKEDHHETIDQMKIMSRSADAAEKAANAAKKSAEVAEMALKIVERADVLLNAASLTMVTAQATHTNTPLSPYSRVSLEFRNFGRTRADNVICLVKLIIPGVPESVPPREPFVLGPGATQTVTFQPFKQTLTEKTYKDIESGAIELKFPGILNYQDIFGESHGIACKGILDPRTGKFILGDTNPLKDTDLV